MYGRVCVDKVVYMFGDKGLGSSTFVEVLCMCVYCVVCSGEASSSLRVVVCHYVILKWQ